MTSVVGSGDSSPNSFQRRPISHAAVTAGSQTTGSRSSDLIELGADGGT